MDVGEVIKLRFGFLEIFLFVINKLSQGKIFYLDLQF